MIPNDHLKLSSGETRESDCTSEKEAEFSRSWKTIKVPVRQLRKRTAKFKFSPFLQILHKDTFFFS